MGSTKLMFKFAAPHQGHPLGKRNLLSNDALGFVASLSREQLQRYRGTCMTAGFHSLAVVPIRYQDEVLGAVHLADPRPGMFAGDTIEFIETASPLIGEAIRRFSVKDSLRQTNELLERIFSSIGLLAAYMDTQFNFIRVNRGYAQADGRDPEYFVGRNHFDLYPNADNLRIFRQVVETGEPFYVFEKPFTYASHPERGVTYWDWSLQPVKGADGRVEGLVLSLIDRTDRVKVQEALREQEALYRAVFDQAFQFVAVLNLDGTVREANQTSLAFFGVDGWKVGTPLWDLRGWGPDGDRALLINAVAQAGQGQLIRHQFEVIGADGAPAIIDFSLKPARDATGRIICLIAEGRDITESKRLERRVLEIVSQEQQQIGNNLQDVLGQDLAGISMLSTMLQQKLSEHSPAEAEEAGRIAQLARRAIGEARGLAMGLCASGQKHDDLVTALQTLAVAMEDLHGIGCTVDSDCTIEVCSPTIVAQLYRIAQEAISNAVRHGKADRVTVRLSGCPDGFELTIHDNGLGLPGDLAGCPGMGLNIMKYRASIIGATLDVRRHPAGGTVVTCCCTQDRSSRRR